MEAIGRRSSAGHFVVQKSGADAGWKVKRKMLILKATEVLEASDL
jgi:hypothetical protein